MTVVFGTHLTHLDGVQVTLRLFVAQQPVTDCWMSGHPLPKADVRSCRCPPTPRAPSARPSAHLGHPFRTRFAAGLLLWPFCRVLSFFSSVLLSASRKVLGLPDLAPAGYHRLVLQVRACHSRHGHHPGGLRRPRQEGRGEGEAENQSSGRG